MEKGCSYAVIDEEKYYSGGNYILVKDCLKSLQGLAHFHRQHLKIPFIAITGSNGKTTTKELIKAVLAAKYKTLATEGNLNNHIGVPLTLLSIANDIEIAVIEMGANHIGEIAMLCEIALPDYGLITNIGRAHIGEFGSFENIVKAKTELYDFIRNRKGKVYVNTENDLLIENAGDIEKISYGSSDENFSKCEFIEADPALKVKFENEIIVFNLVGKYNFENVSAAICIGKYFGISAEQIKKAIEAYTSSNNRSQIIRTNKNTLIMDAYNANPSSMQAAIENFSEMKGENKWLILGDMLELGKYEIEEHKNMLGLVKEKKFQNVILTGEKFSKAGSEIKNNYLFFKSSDELAGRLKTNSPIGNNSLILIKGSRGMKLEKLVEFL